jgi:hypothetical protein
MSIVKLKQELQIGGGLLIANHVDQSLWLANEKQETQAAGAQPFTSIRKLCNYAGLNWFSWAKPANFGFSSSNSTVQGQTLSSVRDALSVWEDWADKEGEKHETLSAMCKEAFLAQ